MNKTKPGWRCLGSGQVIRGSIRASLLSRRGFRQWVRHHAAERGARLGGIILILGLITIGIDMSQYLTCARVEAAEVVGPSGRYFLPLLPTIAFILPQRLRSLATE